VLDSPHARLIHHAERALDRTPVWPDGPTHPSLTAPLGTWAILLGASVRTGVDVSLADPIDAIAGLGSRPILILHGELDINVFWEQAQILDTKLTAAAEKVDVRYTRYADDITASGERLEHVMQFEAAARSIVRRMRSPMLTFNEEKRGLYTLGQRRMVTGLVLTPTQEISIGRAAELAGQPYVEFWHLLTELDLPLPRPIARGRPSSHTSSGPSTRNSYDIGASPAAASGRPMAMLPANSAVGPGASPIRHRPTCCWDTAICGCLPAGKHSRSRAKRFAANWDTSLHATSASTIARCKTLTTRSPCS
jgi:hypothetical protein